MSGAARAAVAVLLAAALAGCSLAPEYRRPATATPAAYKESADQAVPGWKPATPAAELPKGAWWTIFGDGDLDALEDQVTAANQDLQAAVARFAQARAAADYARADYFPQVTANASSQRTQHSKNAALKFQPYVYSDHLLAADLSYEIDVWGRVRNSVAAARDRAEASGADLAAVDLALHAELATDYFALRGYDTQQIVLDHTVAAYERALQVTLNRYKGGAAAEADVDQAQTQLETARTQAHDVHLKRLQMEHAVAILVGQPPAQFSVKPAVLQGAAPAVEPGMPSALLERRPDIAAAERQVAAANAEIGVARAAYYPQFDLSAMMGLDSAAPGKWIEAPSRIWGIGPQAAAILFDGGRLDAMNANARAAYDETVANYRQTVLTAFGEVEDNLAALRQLAQEAQTQDAALAAARRALDQANKRYAGGLVTYLEVVSTENVALSAQLSAVNILTRRMTASVLLAKALGGGWTAADDLALDRAVPKEAADSPM